MSNSLLWFWSGVAIALVFINLNANTIFEIVRQMRSSKGAVNVRAASYTDASWKYPNTMAKVSFFVALDEYDLVIGILSARDNFRQRQGIRNTWLKELNNIRDTRIKAWFVIGETACNLHPDDRLDPYSCEKWTPQFTDGAVVREAVSVIKSLGRSTNEESRIPKQAYRSLHFQVRYPIVIKGLGVLNEILDEFGHVDVILQDLNSQEEVARVRFNRQNRENKQKNGFIYQNTDGEFLLPKGFEGEISLSCLTKSCNPSKLDDMKLESGPLFYPQEHGSNSSASFPVSFLYLLHDLPNLQGHIEGQSLREKDWMNSLNNEKTRLAEEDNLYKDILWVPVIDSYRNLSSKLLQFHKRLQDISDQRFIMKTDDDCFVNLKEITRRIKGLETDNTWWSRFRDQWLVYKTGKWRELKYTADVYPRFACGSGNIISNDISQWLARNSHDLQVFQGEDVSMGIWLSAKGVHYIQDDRWQCDSVSECSNNSLSIPELSPEDMDRLWSNWITCRNMCTCEEKT